MNVTLKQVENAIDEMDCVSEREINDGSGIEGTFVLSDVIADNITQWINEEENDADDPYTWTEEDIIDYIDKTYPILKQSGKYTNWLTNYYRMILNH